jgi:signal peptidase I
MLWILALAAVAGAVLLLRAGRKVIGVVAGIVALAVFAGAFALTVVGQAYRIPSEGMVPTLEMGDRVVAVSADGGQIDDLVIVNPPAAAEEGTDCAERPAPRARCAAPHRERSDVKFVKRIVARGGDRIALRGGRVVRNGQPVDEPFSCTGEACDFSREIEVPRGHVYVLGDNRGSSDDSRFWGPIPDEWVRDRVVARYWPPSRAGAL